ncbi:MAG: FHA domain-containing protein [Eubacteriaceae bacterium]|nr:FHA domain-containing protein [Eubacteriaceae bacterium]
MNTFQSASLTLMPEGERVQLLKSPFFIGSEARLCDFSARDAGLSALNAELKLVDDHWEIRVYPGGKRVHLNHNLLTEDVFFLMKDGDTLDIGDLSFTFRHLCLFSESEQAAMMTAFEAGNMTKTAELLWDKIKICDDRADGAVLDTLFGGERGQQPAAQPEAADVPAEEDDGFEESAPSAPFDEAEVLPEGEENNAVFDVSDSLVYDQTDHDEPAAPDIVSDEAKAALDDEDDLQITGVVPDIGMANESGFEVMTLEWQNPPIGKKDLCMVTKTPFVVGKSDIGVDYQMLDRGISRKHFKIDRKGRNFVIEDMGSTNGVLVNGKYLAPHKPVPIVPGDMITVGLRTYRFDKLS